MSDVVVDFDDRWFVYLVKWLVVVSFFLNGFYGGFFFEKINVVDIKVRMWDYFGFFCVVGGGKNKNFVFGIKYWKLYISVFYF